jgi:hypothetical protein
MSSGLDRSIFPFEFLHIHSSGYVSNVTNRNQETLHSDSFGTSALSLGWFRLVFSFEFVVPSITQYLSNSEFKTTSKSGVDRPLDEVY